MKGIDSNIIVSALNQDLPEHLHCKDLLKRIAEGKETVSIPSIVFMECFHALVNSYKYNESEVKKRLISIIDSENINVLEISISTVLFAFEITEEYKIGGRDSLIAASLLENNIKKIHSHDKDLDKV